MNDQLERAAIAESNGCEVTHVACCQTTNAQRLGEGYDRTIDETDAKVCEASIHIHRTRKITDRRWRVGERASSQILHEHPHPPALVAKEVVDLGEHETWDVPAACLIDGLAKQLVVRGALDEIVDECPGIANQCSCATGWH